MMGKPSSALTSPAPNRLWALLAASLLLGSALLVAMSSWAQSRAPELIALTHTRPSLAVYPPAQSALHFSHARHVESLGCLHCHANADASLRSSDRLLPQMALCLDCHPLDDLAPESSTERVQQRCAYCHLSFDQRPPQWSQPIDPQSLASLLAVDHAPTLSSVPTANLFFSHRRHRDESSSDGCVHCHGARTNEATQAALDHSPRPLPALPEMATCLGCHDHTQVASASCTTCHPFGADGRLLTQFDAAVLAPSGVFRRDDHRSDFVSTHAAVARSDAAYCESCHRPTDCEDCHRGLLRPLAIHPAGFVASHAIDARSDSSSCSSCHALDASCASCHERSFVGEQWTPPSGTRLHSADFGSERMSAGFHSHQARRDLGQCASCHDQQSCIRCHAAINPHPERFARHCQKLLQRNPDTCVQCHGALSLSRLEAECR